MNIDEVRNGYDRVADIYQSRIGNELVAKPFDRNWLSDFARLTQNTRRVVEVGCGCGHITDYLNQQDRSDGARDEPPLAQSRPYTRFEGVDLSPKMIFLAKQAYPGIEFKVADMFALPYSNAEVGAIVSFYSIVNLTPDDCELAFAEFQRVLEKGGLLTLAFHIGQGLQRVSNWWGTDASLDFHLHSVDDITAKLQVAGFTILRTEQRPTYGYEIEAPTERAYLVAQSSRLAV